MRPKLRTTLEYVVAGMTFLAGALVYYRGLLDDIAKKTLVFWGDTVLNAYIVAWGQHALLTQPHRLFQGNFFYPMEFPIALSDNLLGAALITLPLKAFGNPVLTYNVLLFASSFLSAFLWFCVLRGWKIHPLAAWAGGWAFGFLPWRLGQLGHAQLLYTWWIPLTVWVIELWLRRKTLRLAAAAAACVAGGLYTSVYNCYFTAIFAAAFGVAGLAWDGTWREFNRRAALQVVAGCALLVLLVYPAMRAYSSVSKLLGTANPLSSIRPRGASLTDYLHGPPHHAAWGRFGLVGPNTHSDVPWEHNLFLGFTITALSTGLALRLWRSHRSPMGSGSASIRRLALMLAAGGLAAFIISLGPEIHWRGKAKVLNAVYVGLYHYFPGFHAIRVPARAGLLVGFALSGTAAIAIHLLWISPSRRWRPTRRVIALIACLFVLIESFALRISGDSNRDFERHLLAQQAIAEGPSGAVLVLPLEVKLNYLAPLTTFPHFYPLVNGASGHLPPTNGYMFDILRSENWDKRQAQLMEDLGIKYIVWDSTKLGPAHPTSLEELLAFLLEQQIEVEKLAKPADGITLISIANPKSPLPITEAGSNPLSIFHTISRKEGQWEIFVWIKRDGPLAFIPVDAREFRVSTRGYDEDGEQLWHRSTDWLIPNFLPRDFSGSVPVEIPTRNQEATRRIRVLVRQSKLKIKQEYAFDLPQ